MAVLAGNLTSVGTPLQWSLLFARQPEPDLEFTEEELDQTTSTRPISPMKQPGKKSGGGRPLLWILLLALVGGIGYIAMEPEQLMDWLAPLMGETASPEPPQMAAKPAPMMPAPPASRPSPDAMTPAATSPAPSGSAPMTAPLAPAANPISSPMFGEGQKVTAIGNPTIPSETISLTADSAGTKPGPTIRPGDTLTILDGDLQPTGWIYSVKTDEGTKGWIGEKRLRLKF